eukprot:1152875-Pelagomonas_calceolata.AAC.1
MAGGGEPKPAGAWQTTCQIFSSFGWLLAYPQLACVVFSFCLYARNFASTRDNEHEASKQAASNPAHRLGHHNDHKKDICRHTDGYQLVVYNKLSRMIAGIIEGDVVSNKPADET